MEDFSDIIERHQAMVFRTLGRLTGEREGLEDLAQEVFLRLYRALPHFQGRARLSTFVYRIIVNVVNDEFRRRQQARRTVPIEDEAQRLAHPAAGPDDVFERGCIEQALADSFAHLPLRDRTILTLHYQEDRSYEEIAAVLELPLGTVKTHLYRARERLRTAMGEWVSQCGTKC